MAELTEIKQKAAELGYDWPDPPQPVANYVPTRHLGDTVSVSGMVPLEDGEPALSGKRGADVSVEEAQECARNCVLQALAALEAGLQQDFGDVVGVIKLRCYVNSTDDFTGQSQVANGASDLLTELMGVAGRHSRVAVGVNSLPLDVPVEIEFEFAVVQ